MGDGINDAPSMKVSDVGISVDTAVDIAKETADVILLDKDLMVLEKGLVEGRKVYANMTKYIKMTVSSNFGTSFLCSLPASFCLSFQWLPVHLIVLNLIYDLSCIALPLTMSTRNSSRNLVSGKQTPSCVLWPGLVQFHQYLILLPTCFFISLLSQ